MKIFLLTTHGISTYIEEMKSISKDKQKKIPTFEIDLKQLTKMLHIRNKLAHEVNSFNENICTKKELKWIKNFYKLLKKQKDPLSIINQHKKEKSHKNFFIFSFLIIELILFSFILFSKGKLLATTSFISIVIVFIYSLFNIKKNKINYFISFALLNTVFADLCLVVLNPKQQLIGMIFFSIVQITYLIKLQIQKKNKPLLFIRAVLILLVELITVIFLKEKANFLSALSMFYYVNLIVNIIESCTQFKKRKNIYFSVNTLSSL